jgi:hypothetical protein
VLNTEEIALPVVGFEDLYEISSKGRVSNYRKILSPFVNNSGYQVIDLNINGIRVKKLVHRLVAETFLENPLNKKEVNHKDGNKLNNSKENLEWTTSSENKKHALQTGLKIYNIPTKGKKLGKASKYHNVSYDKSRNKWIGFLRVNKQTYYQKRFDTEIEAAKHVNWIIDILGVDRPKNIFS